MIINGYCTLDEFRDHLRSGNVDMGLDPTDDRVIGRIIQQTSRYIDTRTGGRHFYPIIETRYFDVPENTLDDRVLMLDDDLLAATTVTNGDDTTLASTEYNLFPANLYPKYALRIKQSSGYYWRRDSDDNREQVIDVLGIWGFHTDYSRRAWLAGSTLNEAGLTAADVTLTVTSAFNFEPGNLIKIDDEMMLVKSKSGSILTVHARGENGSTAVATHETGTAIYIWQVLDDIKAACMDIAVSYYKRRYGETTSGTATITGAGVVITPQDVPAMAREIIQGYTRAL